MAVAKTAETGAARYEERRCSLVVIRALRLHGVQREVRHQSHAASADQARDPSQQTCMREGVAEQ